MQYQSKRASANPPTSYTKRSIIPATLRTPLTDNESKALNTGQL